MNLVDDEIPLQGGSHASSSHEASLEPTTKRREDLGKHSVYTHFPKDRNARSARGLKLQGLRAEDVLVMSYFSAQKNGDMMTADKILGEGCESRKSPICSRGAGLGTQWIQAYPCKNKTSQETRRSLQKFLEPDRKPKVIYTDNSLEFGKVL